MALIRLIYASTANEDKAKVCVDDILTTARQNNEKNEITGVLLFTGKHFMQCLEGPVAAVEFTFNKILKDSRHSNIQVLDKSSIEERNFDQWSMGYVPKSGLITFISLKYTAFTEFDPYKVQAQFAHEMMLEIRDIL